MKIEDLPIGSKIDLFEREGYESETGTVLGIEDGCLILKFSNKMEKGKFRIPKGACLLRATLNTRGNNLDMYKVEVKDNRR